MASGLVDLTMFYVTLQLVAEPSHVDHLFDPCIRLVKPLMEVPVMGKLEYLLLH
jgi:hypothetical protein